MPTAVFPPNHVCFQKTIVRRLVSRCRLPETLFFNPRLFAPVFGGLGVGFARFRPDKQVEPIQPLGGTAVAAFLGGIAAVTMTLMLPKLVQSRSRIVLVLCGIIVSGFMAAVIGLLKYLADPDTELADIVYWQLGSLAKVSWDNLLYVTPIIVLTLAGLLAMRWRMNVLSLSDQEAASLGVNVQRERLAVIALATLLTASAVCLSGTIGWIGLILPHLARMLVGGNHAQLLPATAVLAASFLMLADLLARTLTSAEVPLGILCGFVGTPFFAWILYRQRRCF